MGVGIADDGEVAEDGVTEVVEGIAEDEGEGGNEAGWVDEVGRNVDPLLVVHQLLWGFWEGMEASS